MAVMKVDKFIAKAKDIANNYKTLYVMGCIGAPLTAGNYQRYTTNYAYNGRADRKAMIKAACDTKPKTFGFDCVCLIKSILWGWNGNTTAPYGGATYASNGVPDVSELGMINMCTDISTDFTKIIPGEAVYQNGHIGIYIGDGKVVECTPAWKNNVQITNLAQRKWIKHGKLPWIDYGKAKPEKEVKPATKNKDKEFLKVNESRGWFQRGDKNENIRKLCQFMYDAFPGYAQVLGRSKYNLLGPVYGENIEAWIKEFQRRTGLEPDGCVGPITLAKLKQFGFKY